MRRRQVAMARKVARILLHEQTVSLALLPVNLLHCIVVERATHKIEQARTKQTARGTLCITVGMCALVGHEGQGMVVPRLNRSYRKRGSNPKRNQLDEQNHLQIATHP
jgi:hypothetical protein